MLAKYGIAYLATGLSFAAIDAAWLSRMGPTFYKSQLGEMMLARPRFDAAIAFYLIYIAGIVFFAVAPAFGHGGTGWKTALGYGAVLGFFAYATYDLTNRATLSTWPWKLTLIDMAWGTFLTGAAATAGYLVTKLIIRA
ncbi:DUF2177 family protein [Allosphingosinicella sp.]|uniref:DUF2177 family protein n=1 Tax=Allosphingosinicella sp. TaxID=2823234 RepID=UPI003783232C